ncbi:hypothetical protein [Paraburkholderia sp. BCC1876]|uniref:hypothetical protein n=1 Tax=Paraburkholderia sp. BCC1876 TaxID=2676303 RepID=UPI00159167F0|nr:hypothetical protein [Paraburkholderia sp. BCC1876]
MKRELENALVERYPAIYRSLQPRFSGGTRFECDDGWYGIIDELSRKLEAESRTTNLRAIEVREKLGSLRFRLQGDTTSTVDTWLAEAARLSQRTCERCGRLAVLRGHTDGRVRTLCLMCATAMGYALE